MKKINFDLRYKVSQRITRNGSEVHIDYRRTAVEQKAISVSSRKAVEFNPDEYQKFKYHRYGQKSYVPTPLRARITTWEQTQKFLLNILFFIFFLSFDLRWFLHTIFVTNVVIQIN